VKSPVVGRGSAGSGNALCTPIIAVEIDRFVALSRFCPGTKRSDAESFSLLNFVSVDGRHEWESPSDCCHWRYSINPMLAHHCHYGYHHPPTRPQPTLSNCGSLEDEPTQEAFRY